MEFRFAAFLTMMADVVENKSLFVSNFDDAVTDSLLYELFLQAGPIDKVTISSAADRNLVGLIVYKHISSVSYAKDVFSGTQLFNRNLLITSDNLFDFAEVKAKEMRDLALRSQDLRNHDEPRRHMEPRYHHSGQHNERHDRYRPYDRRERWRDRGHDERHRNSRNRDDYDSRNRRRY